MSRILFRCFMPAFLSGLPLIGTADGQILPEFFDLAPGLNGATLYMSDDGGTMAGVSEGGLFYLWTAQGGFQLLDLMGISLGNLRGMSADGRRVIGTLGLGTTGHGSGAIWDENGQFTDIGSLFGHDTAPVAISRDGSTAVGFSYLPSSIRRSFMWTASTGIVSLGTLSGPGSSTANAVSDDGRFIAGVAGSNFVERAFRWEASTGMVELPVSHPSEALAISGDGQTVVGLSQSNPSFPDRRDVFHWTATGGVTIIAPNHSVGIRSMTISADGSAAAWYWWSSGRSFYWNATSGLIELPPKWDPASMSEDGTSMVLTAFLNGALVAGRWTAASGVVPLESFGELSVATDMSPDGQWISGMVGSRAVRWSVGGEIGTRYCGPAFPNSSGAPGEIYATGTNLISQRNLILVAEALPRHAWGFFLVSPIQDDVFPVALSQGRLCLGGSIGRFVDAGQIKNTGSAGSFELALPLDAIATPTGSVGASPGQVWNFQAWYRDANPDPTSNFTNAVSVTLN